MKRRLGTSGLRAAPVGLCTRGLIASNGRLDEDRALTTMRMMFDSDAPLLDTAPLFDGAVEDLVGRAIRARGNGVVIGTSGGERFTGGRVTGTDHREAALTGDCHASLRRLGLDTIDLYYLAGEDARVPIEDGVGALAELARKGAVRYVGLCSPSAETLRRAHAVHPISAIKVEYSLLARGVEAELLPLARELGVGVVARRPLGRGHLTGRRPLPAISQSADGPDSSPWFRVEHGSRLARGIWAAERVAARRDLGLARLALAWLLGQGPDVVPVPATSHPVHAEMNTAAVNGRLSPAEVRWLSALFPPKVPPGAPEASA